MTFDAKNLKVYQCAFWNEGDEHGGDIDLANEISLSKIEENIFDDITNAERVAGDTDYRKIFVRNENEETWAAVVAWISQLTLSPDDEIKILCAGTKSKASTPVAITGTCTFTAENQAVVGSGTAFLSELAPGECIYNASDDEESAALAILSIEDDTHLTLADDFDGTAGEGKAANVAGVDVCLMFASPVTKATGLELGDIAENEYKGLWIKRIVDAAASGYENNQFAIKLESS